MRLMIDAETPPSDYIAEAFEYIGDELESRCDAYSHAVEEIEHESRDGFIPFTNGGWDGIAYCSFNQARGSGSWGNAELQKMFDNDYEMMLGQFREFMNGVDGYDRASYPAKLPVNHADMTDQEFFDFFNKEPEFDESNRELFTKKEIGFPQGYSQTPADRYREEYEDGGDDEAFFLKYRCIFYAADNDRNESGEDELYFWWGLNLDLNYGRDSIPWLRAYGSEPNQTKSEGERTVKLADMTPEIMQEIADGIVEFFQGC